MPNLARPPAQQLDGPCANCPLTTSPRFLQLPAEQRQRIAKQLVKQMVVPEGTPLINVGEACETFTLREGWAFRHISLPDGRRQILDFVLPGETVGICGNILGRANHSVTMLTAGVVCCFGALQTDILLRTDPMCGEVLLHLIAAESKRLEQRLVALGQGDAEERLASLLYRLFVRATDGDSAASAASTCFFPPNQRLLGEATGLTPTHVSNTLARLRALGILDLSGRILTVYDHDRLREIADTRTAPIGQTFLI